MLGVDNPSAGVAVGTVAEVMRSLHVGFWVYV